MEKHEVTISVVMAVYNEKIQWIKESVNSILSQSYKDIELIIIVDNPDIDEKIKEYLNVIKNNEKKIIIVYNNENIGLAKSLNIGISRANGKYIARMDADDISEFDRLEKELKFLESCNADMVSCQRINIDENGNEIGKSIHRTDNPNNELPYHNYIVHPGVMMKREVVNKLGGYRNFKKSQDYDLWLRMVSEGCKIRTLDECLIRYRIRKNSISSSNGLEQFYISEYQRKLYRQRLKNGKDNYSDENLSRYILCKKINKKKISRYNSARNQTNIAIEKIKKHDMLFFVNYIKAIFDMPQVPLKSTYALIRMKRIF